MFKASQLYLSGTLEATRTPDLRLRRQLLYPTELRGQLRFGFQNAYILSINNNTFSSFNLLMKFFV